MDKLTQIILTICVLVICIIIGLVAQRDISYSSMSYCDQKYGVCNWTYQEKDVGGFYIGQYWECVPI